MSFEQDFDKIISLLTQKTGINFQQTHKDSVKRFLENRFVELKFETEHEKNEYMKFLLSECDNSMEQTLLINASTVNETYFFREEKQFKVLQSILYQNLKKKEKVNIWSAACSSGEEAYSLKLLADYCGLNADIYATDINTTRLGIVKKGIYRKRSLRQFDGENFHFLLQPFVQGDDVILPQETINQIKTCKNNLALLAKLADGEELLSDKEKAEPFNPGCYFDIIFIRNVFIYFSFELRYKILKVLTDKYLADDGYIFVSMNEIATLEDKKLPEKLEKINFESVYCFHKKIGKVDD